MANILAAKGRMARLALSRNGVEVFVKGEKHTAVFFDGEIESEAGFVKQTSLSFDPETIPYFEKDDSIYVNNVLFKVRRVIDTTNEILVPVEVIRA